MLEKELLITIEEKRNELIQYGMNFGLNSPIVLKHSQELDQLLNCLDQIKTNQKKSKN